MYKQWLPLRSLCGIALALALLLLAIDGRTTASAFCRESLESQSSGPCVADPGVAFLTWERNCMTYRFNDQFFIRMPRLTEAAVRKIFTAVRS